MRAVVADDSMLMREGLARLLTEAGVDVVATAEDAAGLLRQVELTRPDVVVVDIKMPPTHTDEGITAARRIRHDHPATGVLVLSQYLESEYAMRLITDAPEHVGYLLKERVSDVAVLVDALKRLIEGECVIDPTIVSRLMSRRRAAGRSRTSTNAQELLAVIAEGRSDDANRRTTRHRRRGRRAGPRSATCSRVWVLPRRPTAFARALGSRLPSFVAR